MSEKIVFCGNCTGIISSHMSLIRVEDPGTKEKVPICSVNCLTEWLKKHPNELPQESINKTTPKT